MLKGDEATDLYSPALAAQDIQAASAEDGAPLKDDFVAVESPELLTLTRKVKQVAEALDLIPQPNAKQQALSLMGNSNKSGKGFRLAQKRGSS